jgi:hypothetical protein
VIRIRAPIFAVTVNANNLLMAAQLEKALSDVGVPARQEEPTGSGDWIEVYVGPHSNEELK